MYKSIQSTSSVANKNIDQLISEGALDVSFFHKRRDLEISKLKEQELFRKEFIGNLSHELKTPVFSIQGYLDILVDDYKSDDPTHLNFLERAILSTNRIAKLLEELDQITKLETTDIKIDGRPFDLVELILELLNILELQAKEKTMELKLTKPHNAIFVLGDRGKIGQVLTNLIVNSINYGNVNGQTVVTLTQIDDLVTIDVMDNGPGIDPKHWPRLFERFYRVEQSRNRNEGGTGLGLAIVKHILDAHNQTISFRSRVGEGSTFTFSLPKSNKNTTLSSRGIPFD